MTWVENNYLQITAVVAVLILLAGTAKILPAVRQSATLLWLAFGVRVVCGLVLGWALVGVVAWATTLPGLFGSVVGSVGAIVALTLGWHGVFLLIAMVRDVADRTPDEDARKAALWVPTFLPAGGSAVWAVVSNPRGFDTTVAAAIMAVITIAYAHKVVHAALKGKTGRRAWHWFAAAVMLLAGLVGIPLLLFADAQAAQWLGPKLMTSLRILVGVAGLALAVAAVKDIVDRIPDAFVRAFLAYGLPALFLGGATALAFISGNAESGLELVTGGMR
jgi:hypothetical protein